MKRRFSERVYHQRSKDETIFSVIKRTMGDEMRSVRAKGLNNEMRLRMIAYNAMRVASSYLRGFLQSRLSGPRMLRRPRIHRGKGRVRNRQKTVPTSSFPTRVNPLMPRTMKSTSFVDAFV
jgi:phage-related protein